MKTKASVCVMKCEVHVNQTGGLGSDWDRVNQSGIRLMTKELGNQGIQ